MAEGRSRLADFSGGLLAIASRLDTLSAALYIRVSLNSRVFPGSPLARTSDLKTKTIAS